MKALNRSCPFCGKVGSSYCLGLKGQKNTKYFVACDSCGGRGPLSPTKEQGEAGWNNRSLPGQPGESSVLFRRRFENFMREIVAEGIRLEHYSMFVWFEDEPPQRFMNLPMGQFKKQLSEDW